MAPRLPDPMPSPAGPRETLREGEPGADFTVSIVSHGQGELCTRLIGDLAQHAAAAVRQVILTLNSPEPFAIDPAWPFAVRVLRNDRPLGFGENHNRAFAHCRTQFFAVLNPDLRIEQDPFPELRRLLADPGVGVAAPVVREVDGTLADFARPLVSPGEFVRRRFGLGARTDLSAQPDWLAGVFLAFRRDFYADLGGFDTQYFLYCEDVDLCARTRLRGMRLAIARGVEVTHQAQRASRRSLGRMARHVWSLLRLWSSPVYRDYRNLLRGRLGGALIDSRTGSGRG